MLKVAELFFVEHLGAWAVALLPSDPAIALKLGDRLLAGMRSWTVGELHPAPAGLIGARLDGAERLTVGLILRRAGDPMSDAEYRASATLLVRLARAARAVDLDGLIDRIAAEADSDAVSPAHAALARTAIMTKHLIDHGANGDTLFLLAEELGLQGEV